MGGVLSFKFQVSKFEVWLRLSCRLGSGGLPVGVRLAVLLAAVVVAGALFAADGAEGLFEKGRGLLAGVPGVADGIDGDDALGADPDVDALIRFHGRHIRNGRRDQAARLTRMVPSVSLWRVTRSRFRLASCMVL